MDYILQIPSIEKYIALDTNKERLDMCKRRHKEKKIYTIILMVSYI